MNRLKPSFYHYFLEFPFIPVHNSSNVLDNKVYRVTAYKRGDTGITSRSNYAEVVPR